MAAHDGIGTREVDLLEDAAGAGSRDGPLLGHQAVIADADKLSGTDVAHVAGTDDVQGAGLGRDDPAFAKRDVPKATIIADGI